MDQAEFDKFSEEYERMHAANIRLSGETPDFFAEYKVLDVRREAQRLGVTAHPLIVDFGGGIGNSVPFFRNSFPSARITCLDVSRKSLDIAERRFPGQADYVHFDGRELPFDADTVDIAFASCVFHHIDHRQHIALLAELRRILVPGGTLFVFEHNPYNPLTVQAVNTCEFDENAVLIRPGLMRRRLREAGFCIISLNYRIFFPGALAALRPVEQWLRWLPAGAQYYTLAIK